MVTEVILPRVDMDMAEGKIALWHVRNGDPVKKGQLLFDIETDKATMEVEADADGTIDGINGELGVSIPVGQAVAWILAPGEALPAARPAPVAAEAAAPTTAAMASPAMAAVAGTQPGGGGLRATPFARTVARELGVDLRAVAAATALAQVHAKDVRAFAEGQARAGTGTQPGKLHLGWLARAAGVPVLFLHGFGADTGSWRPLATRLEGLALAGIDLPNHGKSPAAAVQSLGDMARAVLARLDAEGLQDLHLVAHSLGAGVAIELAPLLGARLRSLTLLAPAGLGADINGDFIQGLCRASGEAALRARLRELVADPAWITGSFVATALDQLQAPGRREALADMAAALLPDGSQADYVLPRLEGLAAPCKVIWGAEDGIIPVRHLDRVPAHVARHCLRQVGHLPQVEAVELVARLVREQVAAGSR